MPLSPAATVTLCACGTIAYWWHSSTTRASIILPRGIEIILVAELLKAGASLAVVRKPVAARLDARPRSPYIKVRPCMQRPGGAVDSKAVARHVKSMVKSYSERFVTEQATYTLAGPPELRWGNLKEMTA